MKIDLSANEALIRKGGANLMRGWEGVGGRLFLTNQRLLFSSHKFNVQPGPAEIPLRDIQSVEPCWTKLLGLVPIAPNGLVVRTREKEYQFVLYRHHRWAGEIRSAMARLDAGQGSIKSRVTTP